MELGRVVSPLKSVSAKLKRSASRKEKSTIIDCFFFFKVSFKSESDRSLFLRNPNNIGAAFNLVTLSTSNFAIEQLNELQKTSS